ncbi:uncharacterized protein LOC107043061 [Diachasma alloeum]|uniref:uncharacterized protein LOC107043061 n=1 Tax=Diachasma alloeum TaxID=454923 RepID=UPI000738219F|nr:uncharacterized protein LOC107043061 [Diachasma alloeum]
MESNNDNLTHLPENRKLPSLQQKKMTDERRMNLYPKSGSLDYSDALQELKRIKKLHPYEVSKTLQKILGLCQNQVQVAPSTWQPLVIELLTLLASKTYQDEESILSGRIIFSILAKSLPPDDLTRLTSQLLQVPPDHLDIFSQRIPVQDPEIFRLSVINSHLSISKKLHSRTISTDFFTIIHSHCSTYTSHTFLAFRLLKLWLESTLGTSFWAKDTSKLEKQLESLIVSNWDNCIGDVAKWNATEIYPLYLTIMQNKHPNFVEKSWSLVVDRLSWQNPTKFTILSIISSVMSEAPRMRPAHIREMVKSLPKSHLKHPSTKLYLSVWHKVPEDDWLNIFYKTAHPVVKTWEEESDLNALQLFWDLWLRPTLLKFSPSLFFDLWPYLFIDEMIVCQSFFVKLAAERNIGLRSLLESPIIESIRDVKNVWMNRSGLPPVLNDARECVRLNAFTIFCKGARFKEEHEAEAPDYDVCKRFLYLNARAASTRFRKGLLDSFRIFIERMSTRPVKKEELDFSEYIHGFVLNCLEVGSCYQRKIIGLSLHSIISERVRKREEKLWSWTHNNEESFHALARLCLDPVEEVRSKACGILCIFDPAILTEDVKSTLYREGMRNCRSWKFYEVSGGAKLLKVVSKTSQVDFTRELLDEAKTQLSAMRGDILRATTGASPFYGVLTALLETADRDRLGLDEGFVQQLVDLLEQASTFFLASLSPNPGDSEFSSSFAEMGIAIEAIITNSGIIDESDECVLSPAHQTILSCIWMSLATICEVSGSLTYINALGEEIYMRLINIVVRILMKCRHKGVIEVAGGVLGGLMNNQNLRVEHFVEHLEKLLSVDSREVNMTRRGAGQTIMFHKLVSNGDKRSRPLLQMALRRMLKGLRESGNPRKSSIAGGNPTADDPTARQIHFLRSAVADKSLHQHLVTYMEEIALICLMHLRSSEWPVRNASLQLLGAVVTRLVGQAGDEAGHSIEHFATHYPTLAEELLRELKVAREDDDGVMSVLSLLCKMTVSGEDYLDYSSDGYRRGVMEELWELFGHRIAGVRGLVAKTYAAFVPPRDIARTILQMAKGVESSTGGQNHQHCLFLALGYLQARAQYESVCDDEDDRGRILEATAAGLERLDSLLREWAGGQGRIDYIVESAFIKCLLTSPELKNFRFRGDTFCQSSIAERIRGEGDRPGFWEFIDRLAEAHWTFWGFGGWLVDEWTGGIERYNIRLMVHATIGGMKNADPGEHLPGILTALLGKMSAILEGDESPLQVYYPQIFGFVIKVLEDKRCRRNVEETCLKVDVKRIVVKLVGRKNDNERRLGHMLVALTLFDDYELRRMTLEFILRTANFDDDSGKLWALECVGKCLESKKFGDLESDLKLMIIEALVVLLNDEIPEIREAASETMTASRVLEGQGDVRELNKNHADVNLHEVLRLAVSLCSSAEGINRDGKLKCFVKNILGNRYLRRNTGGLESPFNYDEVYREDGKFLNIISQLVDHQLDLQSSSIESSRANEEIDVMRVIEVGRDYQERYIKSLESAANPCRLAILLNIRLEDYMSYKINIVNEIIETNKNHKT